jgi:hypothetical protein
LIFIRTLVHELIPTQRATSDADERIAERLPKLVDEHRHKGTDDQDDDGRGPK